MLSTAAERDPAPSAEPLRVYAAHLRDRALGRAGRRLLDDLQARLAAAAPEGGDGQALVQRAGAC